MLRNSSRARRRDGVAALELALLMPLLVLLLFGLWEMGRWIEIQQVVENAAREGCRQAATGKKSSAEAKLAVLRYLNNAGVTVTDANEAPLSGVVVTVRNVTQDPPTYSGNPPTLVPPSVDVIDSVQSDRLDVSVTVPFHYVRWLTLNWFVAETSSLKATAEWNSAVDVPLTVPTTIPTSPR